MLNLTAFIFTLSNHSWYGLENSGEECPMSAVSSKAKHRSRFAVDLRDELHLEMPDRSGIACRTLLSTIPDVRAYMP